MRELLTTFPREGRLTWIGLSPERRGPMVVAHDVVAEPGRGLTGDRHAKGRPTRREVTLVQAEHLGVLGALVGREVRPEDLRRNLVVEGIPLLALKRARFRVGAVLLEGTGPCEPCHRIEEALGPGGFNAARGHGGITARVVVGGVIRVGDPVAFLDVAE